MTRFLCTALLGALALPAFSQTAPATQRVSVSLGSFLPGANNNDRHSQTSITYFPKLKGLGVLSNASVYLDTNRHKTLTSTGIGSATTLTTKVTAMEGLGFMVQGNVIPVRSQGIYQLAGIGLYRRRVSNTVTTGSGATAVTTATSNEGYSPGLKLGIGYQKKSVFVEADYTIVGRIKGTDPSGLGVRVGMRI